MNGAAAARALAHRGTNVIGFDRYTPPHALGSSHGETRILRTAYFEHPMYVPLVQDALGRWLSLARTSGRALFRQTGGLSIGDADGALVSGVIKSINTHGLPHEVLPARDLRSRYPALEPPPGAIGVLEPDAGALAAEDCVVALLEDASSAGATLRFDEAVTGWREQKGGVLIETSRGTTETDALVLCVGPWLSRFAAVRELGLTVERQVVFWYALEGAADGLPVVIWEASEDALLYAIPGPGSRVKAALHHGGEIVDPDTVDRVASEVDEARVAELLGRLMPQALRRPAVAHSVCLYTNTPDWDFLLDRMPGEEHVYIMSACSGHGFKFAPAMGELIADLILDERPRPDLEPFHTERLRPNQRALD